ncbi:hypothetical protein Y600_6156 [Burkholderia pseudomallei MSHR3709]|nr:hypothetical protein Y600_6156 [Burkholderia pseudomallei MSHR3709]
MRWSTPKIWLDSNIDAIVERRSEASRYGVSVTSLPLSRRSNVHATAYASVRSWSASDHPPVLVAQNIQSPPSIFEARMLSVSWRDTAAP